MKDIKCKITVLRRMLNQDLANEYGKESIPRCPVFKEGQEFIYYHSGEGSKPENFCEHAWHNIYQNVMTLSAHGYYEGWLKNKHSCIVCCTDGLRPVVFKLERETG